MQPLPMHGNHGFCSCSDKGCKDNNVHKNDGLCFYSEEKIIENFPLVVTFASRYFTSFNLIMPLNPSYIFIL